jgi:hypothetical protein
LTALKRGEGEDVVKKLINSVDTMLAESLDGFAAAHADIFDFGRRFWP